MTYKTLKIEPIGPSFCEGSVYDTRGAAPCSRKGKYKEGGKLWCFQHQPSKEKARREERNKKWKREWKAKQRRWARDARIRDAEHALLENVMLLDPIPPGHEWLGKLIKDVEKARNS
jgi:hypothetical protein